MTNNITKGVPYNSATSLWNIKANALTEGEYNPCNLEMPFKSMACLSLFLCYPLKVQTLSWM